MYIELPSTSRGGHRILHNKCVFLPSFFSQALSCFSSSLWTRQSPCHVAACNPGSNCPKGSPLSLLSLSQHVRSWMWPPTQAQAPPQSFQDERNSYRIQIRCSSCEAWLQDCNSPCVNAFPFFPSCFPSFVAGSATNSVVWDETELMVVAKCLLLVLVGWLLK